MKTLIERLWSPEGEGAGGGNGNGADGAGAQGAGGAGGNGAGGAAQGADQGAGGAGGTARFEELATRAGGAFARGRQAGNGKAAGGADAADDGVDPKSKPPGDWPDWLPQKFRGKGKGEINTQGLAEAYAHLESNFAALKNEKGWGKAGEKPEDYIREIKVPDDAKNLDHIRAIDVATDPAVGVFRKVAHKHKLPVDVATGLMLDFLTELNPLMPAPMSEEDILKELGEGAAATRDGLKTWLEGQFTSKTFSEDELEWAFQNFGGSAVGLRVLAKVREMTGEPPIPVNPGREAAGVPSIEEWYAMNRDPRMATDVAFRNKVEAYGEVLFGDEPAGTSEAGVGVPPPRKVDRRERASTQR